MNKAITIFASALTVAFLSTPLLAQSNSVKIQELETVTDSIRNSVDSLSAVIGGIQKSIEENTHSIERLNNGSSESEELKLIKASVERAKYLSHIAKDWATLLILAILLPLLLVFLYLRKTKEDQRRYDTIVDMVRSGVEIKPELLEYLTGSSSRPDKVIRRGILSGMRQEDVNYCSKRLLWAVCIFFIGLIFSVLIAHDEGIIFYIAACFAFVLVAQVAVRYFSVKYYKEHTESQTPTDAE